MPSSPIAETPLLMEKSLYDMLVKYLDEKPYKISKPVLDSIKSMDHPAPGSGETLTVYTMPRASIIYLLNQVINKEETVMTYLYLRAGFERAIAVDREIANKIAEQKLRVVEPTRSNGSAGPAEERVAELIEDAPDTPVTVDAQ
jgi:hypothetical protein